MGTTLQELREFYARVVVPLAEDADGGRLIRAFATVARERFLGPGPWQVITASGYIDTPSDNPTFVYQDVVLALVAERRINNGQPSLHATCMAAATVAAGETVVHIGAGAGYYSAILSELVGPTGQVMALEIDPELANRARKNLTACPNVSVECRSGTAGTLPPADVIYVSAGATMPLKIWLNALRPGGRLIFPLTPADGVGGMLLVTKNEEMPFGAKFVSAAVFIPCIGARDDRTAAALTEAFRYRGTASVERLHVGTAPDDTCWFAGEGWWLSTQ